MDLLPACTEKKRYIVLFMNHFTKFEEDIPLPNQRAETVTRAIVERVILKHGAPQLLLTDGGTNFVSKFVSDTCRLPGVKRLTTTAYYPEANGVVEWPNKTI